MAKKRSSRSVTARKRSSRPVTSRTRSSRPAGARKKRPARPPTSRKRSSRSSPSKRSTRHAAPRPRRPRGEVDAEPPHIPSPTAIVAEVELKGIALRRRYEEEVPGEKDLTAGDPDVDALKNVLVGEEAPGGSVATPDQDRVDDIGRALGVEEVDTGALRTTTELMEGRDRRRAQADEPEPSE